MLFWAGEGCPEGATLGERTAAAGSTTAHLRVVSKCALAGDYFGELKIVDVNIRRLRIKIEDNAQKPTFVNTVWGYGYKWGS